MENVIIRNVKEEDLKQVAEIKVKGWKEAYKGMIDDSYLRALNIDEQIEKFIQRYHQSNTGFIVAELENKVVGFSRYINNNVFSPDIKEVDCELLALYVFPSMKGNGIGKELFNYVKNEFIKQNKEKMILWCLEENYLSRKFYEKMGGKLGTKRKIKIGEKSYSEVSFIYNLQKEDEIK